jgi:SAM-dependent methyltransferase
MNLRALIKRSVALSCAYYLIDDWRARQRLAKGELTTRSGSRHHALDLAASLGYVERVFDDYHHYGGLEQFAGCVAEIGPGDNFGVALLLLKDGAREVHVIDRYRPVRDKATQQRIYQALAAAHGLDHLFSGPPDEHTITGLVRHAGVPAESFFKDKPNTFDAIISRAVMEHLYDPRAALDDMAGALKPGGRLIHRIDLRDHGMFEGHHPLTFLTLPDALYRRMSAGAGRPNRVLLPAWRDWLAGSQLKDELRITRLVGVRQEFEPADWLALPQAARAEALARVHAIQPRLAAPFRDFAEEDLAVAGVVLSARKPMD